MVEKLLRGFTPSASSGLLLLARVYACREPHTECWIHKSAAALTCGGLDPHTHTGPDIQWFQGSGTHPMSAGFWQGGWPMTQVTAASSSTKRPQQHQVHITAFGIVSLGCLTHVTRRARLHDVIQTVTGEGETADAVDPT